MRTLLPLALASCVFLTPATAQSDDWERILAKALESDYSQTRHDGIKGIDTNSLKGLSVLWKVLGIKNPDQVDWYVREGAYEALLRIETDEAEAELDRVLKEKGNEAAKEAIVYSVIWKIRKEFVKKEGGNEDAAIEDAKFRLRKTRGLDYFAMILPTAEAVDPSGKLLKRIQTAFLDPSSRVKLAAITGLLSYPHETSVGPLLENLAALEKKKNKRYREWVWTRFALETLTGQTFREDVDAWQTWWKENQGSFTIKGRIEKAKEEGEKKPDPTRTTTVRKKDVTVSVKTRVHGDPRGYPLLVLPWRQYEPDYFRPYFHGIEEESLVYYVEMPKVSDFKGLERDAKSNLVKYPTELLASALADIMKQNKLERFGVLGHGPESSLLAMHLAAQHPKLVSHIALINPRYSADSFSDAIERVRDLGRRRKCREIEKGAENMWIDQDTGKPTYQPADAAEAEGLQRALQNLRFADPTDPAVGAFEFLYMSGDGEQTLADETWSVAKVFGDRSPRIPALVFMGQNAPWSHTSDMARVAATFRGARAVKLKGASEFPFMFQTYAFNMHVRKFLQKANKKWRKAKKR